MYDACENFIEALHIKWYSWRSICY